MVEAIEGRQSGDSNKSENVMSLSKVIQHLADEALARDPSLAAMDAFVREHYPAFVKVRAALTDEEFASLGDELPGIVMAVAARDRGCSLLAPVQTMQ